MPLADYKKVIEINLIGTFNMMRLFAAALSKAEPLDGGERGVIISDRFGCRLSRARSARPPMPRRRAALSALTMPAARELAQFGIRVDDHRPRHLPYADAARPCRKTRRRASARRCRSRRGWDGRTNTPIVAMFIVRNQYLNGETIRLDGALRMAPR